MNLILWGCNKSVSFAHYDLKFVFRLQFKAKVNLNYFISKIFILHSSKFKFCKLTSLAAHYLKQPRQPKVIHSTLPPQFHNNCTYLSHSFSIMHAHPSLCFRITFTASEVTTAAIHHFTIDITAFACHETKQAQIPTCFCSKSTVIRVGTIKIRFSYIRMCNTKG